MKYYKLTDKRLQTYGGLQWAIGEKKTASDGWFHCYNDPTLAVFLNPIHANFDNPRLFEIEVGGEMEEDCGLNIWVTEMTLVKELPPPRVITTHRVAFGILCTKEVCDDIAWNKWADRWLIGIGRMSADKAMAVSRVAGLPARDAAQAASWAALWAAHRLEPWAEEWEVEFMAAVEAAEAAEAAARAAANNSNINLIDIARKAMGYQRH